MSNKRELDMNVLSNASLNATNTIVKALEKEGECEYKELKLIIEKDPHHEVNNGIRFGLFVREKGKIKFTELGRKYVKNSKEERIRVLREQSKNIKILDICKKRLRTKGKLTVKDIENIWSRITNKEYTPKSTIANVRIVKSWLVSLGFAETVKDRGLKWKRD
ncbi:MAG: AAA-associated domain-containing protein [Methanomicrobia archaeon]|nr:AAA-associated domain-containing protein [Methanomicrobia archaeon]